MITTGRGRRYALNYQVQTVQTASRARFTAAGVALIVTCNAKKSRYFERGD